MRHLYVILLVLISPAVSAKSKIRPDSVNLVRSVGALNEALVNKDSVALNKLLHKKLSYGHSNGWIESRRELIADLYNGKLAYSKIEETEQKIEIVRETAVVRCNMDVDVLLDGKPMTFKLQVLQVWAWKDKEGWRLLGRQSIKM